MTPVPPLTKTDYVAQHVREQILSGQLAPGQRLTVDQLQVELSVSRTPVREAFRVLQAEGLITNQPHQGMSVARQSVEDVKEVFRLRALLESHAVELAIANMTPSTLLELDRIHAQLTAAGERNDAAELIALNREWHQLLYRTAASPRLEEYINRLWAAFPWRITGTLPGRSDNVPAEHAAIQQAIKERDAPTAARLLREHIIQGQDALLQRLRDLDNERRLPNRSRTSPAPR